MSTAKRIPTSRALDRCTGGIPPLNRSPTQERLDLHSSFAADSETDPKCFWKSAFLLSFSAEVLLGQYPIHLAPPLGPRLVLRAQPVLAPLDLVERLHQAVDAEAHQLRRPRVDHRARGVRLQHSVQHHAHDSDLRGGVATLELLAAQPLAQLSLRRPPASVEASEDLRRHTRADLPHAPEVRLVVEALQRLDHRLAGVAGLHLQLVDANLQRSACRAVRSTARGPVPDKLEAAPRGSASICPFDGSTNSSSRRASAVSERVDRDERGVPGRSSASKRTAGAVALSSRIWSASCASCSCPVKMVRSRSVDEGSSPESVSEADVPFALMSPSSLSEPS
eukprot:3215207-Pyramimonas_sp.AAC.1